MPGGRPAGGDQADERQRDEEDGALVAHGLESSASAAAAKPIRHNFVTLLCVVASEPIATLSPRTMSQIFPLRRRSHTHTAIRMHVLLQRFGIPYEVERTVCSECRHVLEERPLKRAAA